MEFEQIILFGSCAKSKSRFGSDIDLMILVNAMPSNDKIFDLRNILYNQIEVSTGIEVDLKVATVENFNSGKNYFYNVIKKEGVILWMN